MSEALDRQLALMCDLTCTETPYWYGSTRRPLHLDVIRPRDAQPMQPALVWFCGGAFQQMDHHLWLPYLVWYAQRGFTVASVEYRVGVNGRWPAPVDDAWAAIRYMRYNAEAFGMDPACMAVMGESAGGYIASALGIGMRMPDGMSPVQAAVNLYGVSDLEKMLAFEKTHGHTSIRDFLSDLPEGQRMSADILSGIHGKTADFLILHGTDDQRVPPENSVRLRDRLLACGSKAELILIEGAGHGSPQVYTEPWRQRILTFLKQSMQ